MLLSSYFFFFFFCVRCLLFESENKLRTHFHLIFKWIEWARAKGKNQREENECFQRQMLMFESQLKERPMKRQHMKSENGSRKPMPRYNETEKANDGTRWKKNHFKSRDRNRRERESERERKSDKERMKQTEREHWVASMFCAFILHFCNVFANIWFTEY